MIDLIMDFATTELKLAIADEKRHMEISVSPGRGGSATLPGRIDYLLSMIKGSKKEIKRVILNQGPGSFTGVRVSFAFAAALATSLGCEILVIPFHTALAVTAAEEFADEDLKIGVILDALRGEGFAAKFQFNKGKLQEEKEIKIIPVIEVEEFLKECDIKIVEKLKGMKIEKDYKKPELKTKDLRKAVVSLGLKQVEKLPTPIYIRKSAAREKKEGK